MGTSECMDEHPLPKLMIVDDNDDLMESLKLALEDRFEVFTAKDGPKCLAGLAHFLPDIVMMDFKLEGMDGSRLAGILWQRFPRLKLVLYSSCLDPDIVSQAKAMGIRDCIDKLADINEISQKLFKFLSAPARHPAGPESWSSHDYPASP
jgi:CheY-like chemotaxis protein